MARAARRTLVLLPALAAAIALSACGTIHEGKGVDSADQAGAKLFNERCSGCHTLSFAAAHGSASDIRVRERNDGPNFNVRKECTVTRVLYAIRNGGFSGAIMPQNIVVGPDATAVAKFLVKYSGRKTTKTNAPGAGTCSNASRSPAGSSGG